MQRLHLSKDPYFSSLYWAGLCWNVHRQRQSGIQPPGTAPHSHACMSTAGARSTTAAMQREKNTVAIPLFQLQAPSAQQSGLHHLKISMTGV